MSLNELKARLVRLRGAHAGQRLPPGCRSHGEWMEKLYREGDLQRSCIRGDITLAECYSEVRALGPLFPERDPSAPPSLVLNGMGDAIKARIEATRPPAHYFEPGGPSALPMVFGGMGDAHYCRDLTPRESKARAAWKAKHDPRGPLIREYLTLDERLEEAKHQRRSLVYMVIGLNRPEAAAMEIFVAWERRWAALLEEKRLAEAAAAEEAKAPVSQRRAARPAPAPEPARRLHVVKSEQPAQAHPGIERPDPLRDYRGDPAEAIPMPEE